MAKPIFIIGFPSKADIEHVQNAAMGIENKFGEEYHVLTYRTSNLEDITFQVLNAVGASDADIEKLAAQVKTEVEELRKENLILKLEAAGSKIIENNQS
jgi:hypothetical protein